MDVKRSKTSNNCLKRLKTFLESNANAEFMARDRRVGDDWISKRSEAQVIGEHGRGSGWVRGANIDRYAY